MADDYIDDDDFDDEFDDDDDFEFGGEIDLDSYRRASEAMDDWSALMLEIMKATTLRMGVPSAPPYKLGRYEAFDTVDGGMGMVVLGRDPDLDRKVAIKLWKTMGPEAEAALRAEAKTLAQFSHPNVVAVYDVGKWRSSVYFVMESVEGTSGHIWMHRRARTWQEVREVFVGAGLGLGAAHDAGIQHRDFKPANMLVGDDGRVLVLDFGIADKLRSADESSDGEPADDQASATVVAGAGTVTYMAPERLRGRRGDARSDQFSFCVAMWKALHGVRPFAGYTADELLAAIERGAIRTQTPTAEVPHWLSRIVRKGLAVDPDLRHRDMHELVAALREGAASSGGGSVEGETEGEAVTGSSGRLLNAPLAGAQGGAVDTQALAVELAKLLQPASGAWPAPPERRRGRDVLVALGSMVVGAGVVLLILVMLRPATPTVVDGAGQVAVLKDPLDVILAHVAADEFSEAEALWRENWREQSSSERDPQLGDAESLTIARACLARAKKLEPVSPADSADAAELATKIATFVTTYGRDARAKQAGGQLNEDATQFLRGRPPADSDASGG